MRKLKEITKKIITLSLVSILAVSGITGCGSNEQKSDVKSTTSGSGENKSDGKLTPIRLGVGGQGTNYMMESANLAYKNGYLEEELKKAGYSLELQAFLQTGPEVNAALASGSLDGAIYGDFPVFTSNGTGISTTVIASVNKKTVYGILTTSKDIKKPKDLEGKRVIVGQGTIMQYFWEKYVAANKLDKNKIEIINTTDGASLLQSGEADAYLSIMTSAKLMEKKGLGKVFDDSSSVPEGNSVGVVVLENKFLSKNPKAAVAINKALIRAYKDAQANPESFYKSLATETIPEDIQKSGYEIDPTLSQLNPEITDDVIKRFNELNDWMVKNKIIPSAVDVNKLYDKSFYEQAVKEIGK